LGTFDSFKSQLDGCFALTREAIEQVDGPDAGDRYTRIFSRPIAEHRRLLQDPSYKIGRDALRLSPLDRFPLVAGKDGRTWYAPNVRGLACSAPDVVHFALNEHCRSEYEEVCGALLEIYLENMLTEREPTLAIIPEEKWTTRKGQAAGPDLLIIDHSETDPILLAVEIKFRHMLPSTRYELLDEDLSSNYASLWTDLKKLPQKLERVFALAGGYVSHRDDLRRAQHYPRFLLGIVGEAPYAFSELVEHRRRNDPEFPLFGAKPSVCAMSVDTFEHLIEVVVQHNRTLAGALRDYLENCANLEIHRNRAEAFRGVDIYEGKSFAASFATHLRTLRQG
jgi:hypothetical protein